MMKRSFLVAAGVVSLTVVTFTAPVLGGGVRVAGAGAPYEQADGAKLAQTVIDKLGTKPQVWLMMGWKPRTKITPEEHLAQQEELLRQVRSVDPSIPLIGACIPTVAAMAFGEGEPVLNTSGPTLIGLVGEGVTLKTGFAQFAGPGQLTQAGRNLAEQVKPESGKGAMILITDAVISHDSRYNLPAFYKAIQDVLGPEVVVLGGNAGYGRCPIYSDDTVTMGAMVALTISGSVSQVKSIVETGKTIISPPLTITRVDEAKPGRHMGLVDLDGTHWLDLFRQYAGEGVSQKQIQDVLENKASWGKIGGQYPYALLTEHDRPYVRLAHGIKPFAGEEGLFSLTSECYPLKNGDRVVFMKSQEDTIKPVGDGMKRLKADMPAGQALFLLFPCQSNGSMTKDRQRLLETLSSELPAGAALLGFLPCGEHASWYEPGLDEGVCEARYHQLSFPMGLMVFQE